MSSLFFFGGKNYLVLICGQEKTCKNNVQIVKAMYFRETFRGIFEDSHPKFHHYLVISPIIYQMNILISLINPINDNGSDT